MNNQWYIVQTKPAAEEHVRLRWDQVGFEVFLPKLKKMVRGQKKPVERFSPLFPSYLFIKLNLDDSLSFRKVRYTRGVRRILGLGELPLPVNDDIIHLIRERVDSQGVLEEQLMYNRGDQVRIKHGPLADFVGVLEKRVSAAGRVRILLEVYRKSIRVDLSCTSIERI